MNERVGVPFRSAPSLRARPPEDVLSAISELAEHVRACNLGRADDLLTELLVLLHSERRGAGRGGILPGGIAL